MLLNPDCMDVMYQDATVLMALCLQSLLQCKKTQKRQLNSAVSKENAQIPWITA